MKMEIEIIRYIPQTRNNIILNDKTASQTNFLKRARKIHGNHYDYPNIDTCITASQTNSSKIQLICNFCKYSCFLTIYQHLIQKRGCPNCSRNSEWDLLNYLKSGSEIFSVADKENL